MVSISTGFFFTLVLSGTAFSIKSKIVGDDIGINWSGLTKTGAGFGNKRLI